MSKKRFAHIEIGLLLNLVVVAVFIVVAAIVVTLVNHQVRQQALTEATSKARILLDRNLATHTYFSHDLKPSLFEWTEPFRADDYFDPTWMSSTYAVREIDEYFHSLNPADYYYKECAINARSPENEADAYERAFIEELNENPDLTERSLIRTLDGKPYFVTLRRGEVMEESCLRCHSTPGQAPGGLIDHYGSERSFYREVGDVVSAISIRVPLSAAYAEANRLSWQLSGSLLLLFACIFVFQWLLNQRLLFGPLSRIRDKALQISTGDEHLGEKIPLPFGRELSELTTAFNTMSVSLRRSRDHLEERVKRRTAELMAANEQLEDEIAERARVEQALREGEERFKILFEFAPDAYYMSDLKGDFIDGNKAAEELTGYDKNELIGKSFLKLKMLSLRQIPRAAALLARNALGKATGPDEFVLNRKDGSQVPVEIRTFPVQIKGQSVVLGIARDITERKRVEEERERLLAAEREQRLLAETLRDVTLALTAQVSHEAVLDEVLRQTQRIVPHSTANIALLEDDMLHVVRWQGYEALGAEAFVANLKQPLADLSLNAEVVQSRKPMTISDTRREPRWVTHDQTAWIRSCLILPICLRDRVLGLLRLDSDTSGQFSDEDAQRLQPLANAAAIAIDNARLYEAEARRRQEAETLRETALALTTILDRNQVIERILVQLQQVVPYDTASVQLLRGDRLEIVGGHGFPDPQGVLGVSFPVDVDAERAAVAQRSKDNPNSEVVRTRAPLIVDDAPAVYETFRHIPSARHIRSWLGAPMLIGERLVGIIALDRREAGFYTQRHARLAEAFAAQAAVAFENARLFEDIGQRQMYLEGVLNAAPDAIVTLDARHRIVEWNPGAERLFGYSWEEAIGQDIDDLITGPEVYDEAVEFTQVAAGGMEVPPTETVRYRKDGSPVDVLLAGSPIVVGDELIGAVAVYTDITTRVRMEETLRAMALLDDLTGLYNRRGFSVLAEHQLKMAERGKRRMVLLFADLDGMKHINDTFGHSEGDRALIETADILEETFRESDIVARIGGDEFVVLAIETNGSPAEGLVTRLRENLEALNAQADRRYELSLSVGLAHYDPEDPCSLEDLLTQADREMYEQKQG